MRNWVDPGLVMAPPPAPDLMKFVQGPEVLWPELDIEAYRRFVVAVIRSFNGFGCGKITSGEKPPIGRSEAYGHLLFAFEGDNDIARGYARGCPKDKSLSSCGVTVRALWLLLGARHPLLDPKYIHGTVMVYVRAYAILCNAFRGNEGGVIQRGKNDGKIGEDEDKDVYMRKHPIPPLTWDTFDPQPGDVLFMEKSQHLSTIVEIVTPKNDDFVEYISCDGGQRPRDGDKPCCGISLIKRKASRTGQKTAWGEMIKDQAAGGSKEVHGWADITKIKWVAPPFTPFRNQGRLDLPDPKPIGGG